MRDKIQILEERNNEKRQSETFKAKNEELEQSLQAIKLKLESIELAKASEREAVAGEKADSVLKLENASKQVRNAEGANLALREQINSMQELRRKSEADA